MHPTLMAMVAAEQEASAAARRHAVTGGERGARARRGVSRWTRVRARAVPVTATLLTSGAPSAGQQERVAPATRRVCCA
jgi:hypothetical protein